MRITRNIFKDFKTMQKFDAVFDSKAVESGKYNPSGNIKGN